jgi:hypothetical protein
MNLADAPALLAELTKMALAFNAKPVTTELTEVWMEALIDVPWPHVQGAMEDHRKHGRFWPRPSTIRELVDRASVARQSRRSAGAVPDDPSAPPHCSRCEDTGWELGLFCPGDGRCGHHGCRTTALDGHTFTRPCRCRATNPVYQATSRRTYHRPEAA